MSIITSLKSRATSLLRRGERFTGTDNIYLAKNGFFLTLMQSFGVLTGFLQYILIARFLPKEVYGEYKYFLSLFSLFSIAAMTGMENALGRAVANGFEGSLPKAFRYKFIGGLFGSLAMLIGSGYYFWQANTDTALALALIACFSPWIYASNVYSAFLSGKKRFDLTSRYTVYATFISFIGMATGLYFLRNAVALLLVFLVTSLTNGIAYLIARSKQTNDTVDPTMFALGKHLSILDILGTVANNLDSILVFHFLGAASLAVYSLAIIPVEQMKGFLKIISSLAMPKYATRSLEAVQSGLRKKILLFMGGVVVLMGIYILLAPAFFAFFFPSYQSSVPYSQVYALSLITGAPATLLLTAILAQNMKKALTYSNVLNYSAQILFLLIGSYFFGLWGVIISRIFSRIFQLVCSYVLLHRPETPEISTPTATI